MRHLNVLLIIFSIVANASSVGDRENGFDRKLFDLGLETCIENFDVHVDKIIRTQDSRAMGAKYLNEAEVNGRDECMKLCCETSSCDVFVYEQKNPGSCYLFHCGSPEDFKCKFTQHRNYTSAVLALNRIGELENRMKLIKHEEELTELRKLDHSLETTPPSPSSTKVPVVPVQTKNQTQKNKCSRYQFECKESEECIAIYNACDGIPQCSDGSDEALELDCPTISGLTHPKTFHNQLKNLKASIGNSTQEGYISESTASPEIVQQLKQPILKSQSPQFQQQQAPLNYFPNGYSRQKEQVFEFNQAKVEQPQQMVSQPRYYGREGEMMQYPVGGVQQWQGSYQPQRQDEGNHIFGHKGTGVVPDNTDSQIPVPYNNELNHADYVKYAAAAATNNGYYGNSGPVFYPGPNGWMHRYPQQPRGIDDNPQRPMLPMYGNGMSGPMPSDYYYEDSQLRGRYPQDLRKNHNSDSYYYTNQNNNNFPKEPEKLEVSKENNRKDGSKKMESVKKTLDYPSPSTVAEISTKQSATSTSTAATAKPERPHPTPGVAERLKMSDSKEVDGINQKPSGAILSLTLGMCITAIMITLVGCRLRVVRKKMRRNGKSPFAHDADFLVNGMYL